MKLSRKHDERDLVNLTPLIDVVFILLIFFMLAGAIKRPEQIVVDPPRSNVEEEGDESELVILVGAEGETAFDGEPMPSDDDLMRNARIWISARPDIEIQLKADANADATRVIDIMQLLREAGAKSLVLLTVGADNPEAAS